MSAFLCGEYRHQADEKGRIRIPAKLKNCLDENSVIMRGQSGCLVVFSGKEFEAVIEKFKQVPLSDAKAQGILRNIFASTFTLEEDGQGRTLIPAALREAAKLSKNIVSVGVTNRIEIWNEESYNKLVQTDFSLDDMLEGLKEYGV